jgi:hypothetical protein
MFPPILDFNTPKGFFFPPIYTRNLDVFVAGKRGGQTTPLKAPAALLQLTPLPVV